MSKKPTDWTVEFGAYGDSLYFHQPRSQRRGPPLGVGIEMTTEMAVFAFHSRGDTPHVHNDTTRSFEDPCDAFVYARELIEQMESGDYPSNTHEGLTP